MGIGYSRFLIRQKKSRSSHKRDGLFEMLAGPWHWRNYDFAPAKETGVERTCSGPQKSYGNRHDNEKSGT